MDPTSDRDCAYMLDEAFSTLLQVEMDTRTDSSDGLGRSADWRAALKNVEIVRDELRRRST